MICTKQKKKKINVAPFTGTVLLLWLWAIAILGSTLLLSCAPGCGRDNLSIFDNTETQDKYNSHQGSRFLAAWQETAPGKKEWGFIDITGHFVIQPQYEGACIDAATGLLTVKKNGYWGIISSDQRVILDFTYAFPLFFSNGLAPVKISGRWGFINSQGKQVIPPVYEQVKLFVKDGKQLLARVRDKGFWGLIDATGRYILPPQYDLVTDCYDGLLGNKLENKYGFINKKGEQVIKPLFKNIKRFSYRIAPAQAENGKWGYINTKGEFLDSPAFTDAEWAGDIDYYPVRIDKFWGYIDTKGKIRIPAMYDEAGPFFNGTATVIKKGISGYINKKNAVIWDTSRALYFMEEKNLPPTLRSRLLTALEKQMTSPAYSISHILKARPWEIPETIPPTGTGNGFFTQFGEYKYLISCLAFPDELQTVRNPVADSGSAVAGQLPANTDWQAIKTWYGIFYMHNSISIKKELNWFLVELTD